VWTAWFVLQIAVGAVAIILVWLLIVAIVVAHVEDRPHGRHRFARHSGR
jgi:hypothetical protein